MDKHTNNKSSHNNDSMLKEKTNQDYNKQKPDPKDPNQKTQYLEGEEEERENKERAFKAKSGDNSKDAQRKNNGNKDAKNKNEESNPTASDRTNQFHKDDETADRHPSNNRENGNRKHDMDGKQNENKFEKQEPKKGRL